TPPQPGDVRKETEIKNPRDDQPSKLIAYKTPPGGPGGLQLDIQLPKQIPNHVQFYADRIDGVYPDGHKETTYRGNEADKPKFTAELPTTPPSKIESPVVRTAEVIPG